jgi:lysophospholipase L1-like esterase
LLAQPSFADNLICFGDSQTAIRMPLVQSDTFCYKMAHATRKTDINKGIGGNTSADGLARLTNDVLMQPGSCVTVMFGANDAFIDNAATYDYSAYWMTPKPSAVSVAQYMTNLTSMIQQITGAGKRVTLITPWAFWSTPQLNQLPFYVDAMKAVAVQTGTPLLDAYEIQLNRWWSSQPWLPASTNAPMMWDQEQDYQHPNGMGHTEIADLCKKPQNKNACACKV